MTVLSRKRRCNRRRCSYSLHTASYDTDFRGDRRRPFLATTDGSLSKSVHESYAQEELAMAETTAVTPSATDAMKSRFSVSIVSDGRW